MMRKDYISLKITDFLRNESNSFKIETFFILRVKTLYFAMGYIIIILGSRLEIFFRCAIFYESLQDNIS